MAASMAWWGNYEIAKLDSILAIAQLMGQADLPGLLVAALPAVEVRDPEGGL
jgi:hypothetical protein